MAHFTYFRFYKSRKGYNVCRKKIFPNLVQLLNIIEDYMKVNGFVCTSVMGNGLRDLVVANNGIINSKNGWGAMLLQKM